MFETICDAPLGPLVAVMFSKPWPAVVTGVALPVSAVPAGMPGPRMCSVDWLSPTMPLAMLV